MWKPIATAPKDGSFVLICDTEYPSELMIIARWRFDAWRSRRNWKEDEMTKQLNHSHKLGDIFYRATPHGYDFSSRCKAIEYEQWEVVKLTPKGVWLSKKNPDPDTIMYDYGRDKRFALTPGVKWVSPTKKEAVWMLLTRRVNQLKILQSQINVAKQEYDLAFEAWGKLEDE